MFPDLHAVKKYFFHMW